MRVPSVVPLLLLLPLLLLSLAPAAAAEPMDGSFQSTGTTRMQGALDLTWDLAGAFLEPVPGTRVALTLRDASVAYVNLPYEDVVVPTLGEPHHARGHTGEEEVLWTATGSGTLRLAADGAATVRILPAGSLAAHSLGDEAVLRPAGVGWRAPHHAEPFPLEGVGAVRGVPAVPAGAHTEARTDDLRMQGAVHVLLAGGDATWGGQAVPTGMHRSDASVTDPLTDSGRRSYDDLVLVATGHLEAVEADRGGWTLAARGVDGTLDGSVEWRGVTGQARLDGAPLRSDPDALRAEGHLAVRSDLRSAPAEWEARGDVQAVHVDRIPVLEAVAAASAGALLLALLFEPVRALLADLLARVLPLRLQSRHGDASRHRILTAVHEHQPVRVTDLARSTGLSRGALRHHLRLLLRDGVLQTHAAGPRNRTYMLNGGSLRFRVASASGAVAADAALSVSHGHPVRRALLERLSRGPARQDDLLEHLADAGLAVHRSTLSHHLRRMEDAGAVAAAWEGGRKTYRGLDADALRLEQYRRYLLGHGLLDVVQALAARPDLDRREVAALTRRAPDAPDADRLVDLAVLERRRGRYRLAAPLADLARRLGSAS